MRHTLVVHKFGGSSLANAERFKAVKALLSGNNEIIVVSATYGTTTQLQQALDIAKKKMAFLKKLTPLEKRHAELIRSLLAKPKATELLHELHHDFAEIKDILHAVSLTRSYSKEIQDMILGYGEQWSAKILTAYLAHNQAVCYLDATQVLFTYEKNNVICIDWEKSATALKNFLKRNSFKQLVVTGYIAATLKGKRTTLGRNGSDFSAAIFAKLFKATQLTIWTDVDGIYTADPGRVRSAFAIESLSYKEALELAYFGAKVLHPMSIAPVLEDHIPIYIKNSYHPEATGTYISADHQKSAYAIKGLTCIDQVALVSIEGTGMIGVSGIAARVFSILHKENISVILIAQASSEHSICFAIANTHAEAAKKILTEHLQFELSRKQIEKILIDKQCAILAAVGDDMVGTIGISGKLCTALAKANVNIRAISQGSSERNISVVVKKDDINRALQAVHAGFYLSHKTLSIGLIGPGHVGSALLKQLEETFYQLQSKYQVNLYVRGIMDSKKMLLQHEPIPLKEWQKTFSQTKTKANITDFINHIFADDIPHAVIIDCTATQHIAHYYLDMFKKGIHVITPNKHANAGDLEYYKKIKSITQKKNLHYLYEATVCAGLPIINTLQDIIKTGDEVIRIEGIVSGTLSYIFNELALGRTFSDIVRDAARLGYTEPDPREDLSGMDVARKLVCLAREMGHAVTLNDVKVHDLVPGALKSCSIEEFLKQLPKYDHEMAAFVAKAHQAQEKLCYVGIIHADGSMQVTLKPFTKNHPFSSLKRTDNMMVFYTKRYQQQPLIVQGPGAGGEVTAAGIFADLLRLVSYLS